MLDKIAKRFQNCPIFGIYVQYRDQNIFTRTQMYRVVFSFLFKNMPNQDLRNL